MKPIRISDVLELPVAERLKLVEAIWDSIAEAPEALQLTEAQRAELDRRLDEYEQDPEAGSPDHALKTANKCSSRRAKTHAAHNDVRCHIIDSSRA